MKTFHLTKQLGLATILVILNNSAYGQIRDRMQDAPDSYVGDKLPPYNNPNRFLMQASLFFWQPDVDGVDFAMSQNLQGVGINTSTATTSLDTSNFTGQVKNTNLHFRWDPGFKIGLGAIFGTRDEWDFLLNWTWFESKAHRSVNTSEFPSVVSSTDLASLTSGPSATPGSTPLFGVTLTAFPKTTWKLHYNTLDLEFGRNFFLEKNLILRPHIGLKGAWIHQSTNVKYTFDSEGAGALSSSLVDVNSGVANLIGTLQFNGKNNYNGIGIRGGLDMRLNFLKHYCLYGTLAGAILYGEFKINESLFAEGNSLAADTTQTTVTSFTSQTNLKDAYHRTRTNFQAVLGFMWHRGFNKDKQHLSIGLSYEANEWSQQNELTNAIGNISFTTGRTNGDLGLHGVTLDVKFDL